MIGIEEGQFKSPSLTLPPTPYNAHRKVVKLVKSHTAGFEKCGFYINKSPWPIGNIILNVTYNYCTELKQYDIFLEINGKNIFLEDPDSVGTIIKGINQGAVVELLIERGGCCSLCSFVRERASKREREREMERERD